jgi:hypothetical protein
VINFKAAAEYLSASYFSFIFVIPTLSVTEVEEIQGGELQPISPSISFFLYEIVWMKIRKRQEILLMT